MSPFRESADCRRFKRQLSDDDRLALRFSLRRNKQVPTGDLPVQNGGLPVQSGVEEIAAPEMLLHGFPNNALSRTISMELNETMTVMLV